VNGISVELRKERKKKIGKVSEEFERKEKRKGEKERRTVTSIRLNRIPRMFSSQTTPSLVAHWKAATHESLISFMN